MMIVWGLYSIPARGEWVRSIERIGLDSYAKYLAEFNPVGCDPASWARSAKDAGVKYAVFTAKHHEGFCLFDTALTSYNSAASCGRDFVREYIDAFRNAGIKVGIYYSLLDWHHPDYPPYGDRFHPERDNEAFKDAPRDFSIYLKYMHGQIKELCSNYGKIDIMWLDFSYNELSGEAWEATKLVSMIRSLQPGIVINNRLDLSGGLALPTPPVYAGDFLSPEQMIPPRPMADKQGKPLPWEACATLSNNWSYAVSDKMFKPSRLLIRKLVECVSKGGNLILGVGPDPKGQLEPEALSSLSGLGRFLSQNGDSVYGAGPSEFPKPDWGCYTQKGNTLYAHVFENSIGPLCLPGLARRAKSIRLLSTGAELPLGPFWNTWEYPDDAFTSFGPVPHLTYPLPDEDDTVLEIKLE
jgi:alpha-L-fucosidase